jgi:hypothetical protein
MLVLRPLTAQVPPEDAAGRARRLWLAHDIAALVSGSDTVRVRLPGVAPSGALGPAQAARLLSRYLESAEELAFDLQGVRRAGADQAYAEGQRRYVVRGTSEERRETVFLGFRLLGGAWRLWEVRIVP